MAAYDITTNGALEFDTNTVAYISSKLIDSNHFIVFWQRTGTNGWAQVMEVNTTTWAITTSNATQLRYNTQQVDWNSCQKIDDNHFINFSDYNISRADAQVFTVNTSTWEVTTAGAILSYNTTLGSVYPSSYKIDDTHYILFYADNVDEDGFVQVFAVNTSTWTVSTTNTPLEFDTGGGKYNSCFAIDANHFINFWGDTDNDGRVQVFTVNTSTWAVTTANSNLEFDTSVGLYHSCYQIDSNHFINFWRGVGNDGFAQVFAVNTSTWAVTTAGTSFEFDTQNSAYNYCNQIDETHYILYWLGGASSYLRTQVVAVNTSTWAITTAGALLEISTLGNTAYTSVIKIDTNHFVFFDKKTDQHGYVEAYTVELPTASGPTNLKSLDTNLKANIKSVNTNLIANVKSINTNT